MSGSELGELFNAWDEHKRKKKADNNKFSTQLLIDHNIKFYSFNQGLHLVIEAPDGLIDYWPNTGLWKDRNKGISRRGVRKLLAFIGVKNEHHT